jgi:hypothetical protein
MACRCREPRPVSVDHRGIRDDHGKQVSVQTGGDDLPVFVSPELGEIEPTRHFTAYLSCAETNPPPQMPSAARVIETARVVL